MVATEYIIISISLYNVEYHMARITTASVFIATSYSIDLSTAVVVSVLIHLV
jgi:hypothetical protein